MGIGEPPSTPQFRPFRKPREGTYGHLLGRESDSAMRLLAGVDQATGKRFVRCRSAWVSSSLGAAGDAAAEIAQRHKSASASMALLLHGVATGTPTVLLHGQSGSVP